MSRAEGPSKNDRAQIRALVNRQAQAWEKRDFAIAADDWLPNGELFSPGGHVLKNDQSSSVLREKHLVYRDLEISEILEIGKDRALHVLSNGIGPSLARETAKERRPMTLSLCIWLEEKSALGTNTSGDWSKRSQFTKPVSPQSKKQL